MNLEVALDKCAHSDSTENEANATFDIIPLREGKYPHYLQDLHFPERGPVIHMFTSQPQGSNSRPVAQLCLL